MPVTDETVLIPAPPEAVFDYLNDPSHLPVFDPTILSTERDGDGPLKVGSRVKGVSKILGHTFDWTVEVIEANRPTKQVVTTVEGRIAFTASYTISPEAGGTRLNYRLESGSGLGGVFDEAADSFVSNIGQRQSRTNLATLSEILAMQGRRAG